MHIFEREVPFDILNCAGVVGDRDAGKLAVSMRDLYLECSRQIISKDDLTIQALMMPTMAGGHYLYTVGEAGDIDEDAGEFLDDPEVSPDLVAVLGKDILEKDRSEDEMLEVVLADLALHVAKLCSVADRRFGEMAMHVGWAAVASTMASAHDVIRFEGAQGVMVEKIKNVAISAVVKRRTVALKSRRVADHRVAIDTIENVCDIAMKTRGGFIPLPATAKDIGDCAKIALLDALEVRKVA